MSGFSIKAGQTSNPDLDESKKEERPFIRDTSDNKIFKSIQVKDISTITNKDTVGVWDFDTALWKAAANMENKFIRVTLKEDKSVAEDLKGIQVFKGLGKKIGENSWLGTQNVDRELQGLPLWSPEDFDIEEGQTLKFDKDKCLEQAKIQIHTQMKKIRLQYGLSKIKVAIGEGDNFRNELDLCRPYKGQRNPAARPLILKDLRKWVVSELDCEEAYPRADGQNVEADDLVEYYGALGYKSFRKTGIFSYVVIASDKDAKGNPKLLIDPDTHSGKDNPLKGKFKLPQAMLIEATDKSAGDLELVAKSSGSEVKGFGFKFILYQALLGGDTADNYNAISHLGKKLGFGDKSAYKALKSCESAKDALQSAIDVYAELLPYGVQYTTFAGKDLDVDCMTYMNTYFQVAYMLRSSDDTMDFYKLCKAFKVDTSKVLGNNKLCPPEKVYVGHEAYTVALKEEVDTLLKTTLKSYKSLKKDALVGLLDTLKENLSAIDFDQFYEMQQKEKENLS
jgi:hypothetical protein